MGSAIQEGSGRAGQGRGGPRAGGGLVGKVMSEPGLDELEFFSATDLLSQLDRTPDHTEAVSSPMKWREYLTYCQQLKGQTDFDKAAGLC